MKFYLVISIGLLSLFAAPACAEDSVWLRGFTAYLTVGKMGKQGFMPTSIACRDSNLKGLDVAETEYKVSYAKRPDGVKFMWAVGSEYGRYRKLAEKEGYRQVGFDQYKRKKSGLVVRCAIWHKQG